MTRRGVCFFSLLLASIAAPLSDIPHNQPLFAPQYSILDRDYAQYFLGAILYLLPEWQNQSHTWFALAELTPLGSRVLIHFLPT